MELAFILTILLDVNNLHARFITRNIEKDGFRNRKPSLFSKKFIYK